MRAAVLLVLLAVPACRAAERGRHVPAEEAVLERQRKGLEGLIRAAGEGPLIPFPQVLVIVDEDLVQGLLAAAIPFERVVAGRYRVRIDAAQVNFDDGFALVRLDGRASLARGPEAAAFADVSVFGSLDLVELDPASGVLRGRINVMAFEAKRVGVLGVDAPAQRQAEALGREKLESFSALASSVEIPVRLERELILPAAGPEGGVRIAAATVPVRAAVTDVKAFRGRLWISLSASVGGAEPARTASPGT